AIAILALAHGLPKLKRRGPVKDGTYESGMEPIGDARGRFNVRFYLVAMLFLLFDVELIFMYPWAVVFQRSVTGDGAAAAMTAEGFGPGFLLGEMAIFMIILLVGYAYAWRKRIFLD
ncbi:MAG: NADH-quinone oxidoreductase subunit A, partial [Phycisphaerae bacterium]